MPTNANYPYGCLMVDFKITNGEELLDLAIDKNDIYNDRTGDPGLEDKPHISILYGFHENIDLDKLKKITPDINDLVATISKFDIFENEIYDVVVFKIDSPNLTKLNKKVRNNFDYTSDYPDYEPHMTLAYVKSGAGETYKNKKIFNIKIKPYRYRYSFPGNEKNQITWS